MSSLQGNATLHISRHGSAQPDIARHGWVWHGATKQGKTRLSDFRGDSPLGVAGRRKAQQDKARTTSFKPARDRTAHRTPRRDVTRPCVTRQEQSVFSAGRDYSRLGNARRGMTRLGTAGPDRSPHDWAQRYKTRTHSLRFATAHVMAPLSNAQQRKTRTQVFDASQRGAGLSRTRRSYASLVTTWPNIARQTL